ncbi:hypothetical protein HPB50_016693 [Hyalomma asiaticum]|uniref:Uncharacterized protein n=1 Tax=Hyalomma asiaticum TaxID=266040 RepID=A0ACB7TAL0_HYAAI|nr:hypothetical protein HPB50_016693 [Hyalomma asiaticum]
MKWRRLFQAYVDLATGHDALLSLKKRLLLNTLGVEGLYIYWALQEVQIQAESRTRTRDRGTEEDVYKTALTVLCNYFKTPSNEVLELHHFKNRTKFTGQSLTDFIAALQVLASNCNFGASVDSMIRDNLFSGITAPHGDDPEADDELKDDIVGNDYPATVVMGADETSTAGDAWRTCWRIEGAGDKRNRETVNMYEDDTQGQRERR